MKSKCSASRLTGLAISSPSGTARAPPEVKSFWKSMISSALAITSPLGVRSADGTRALRVGHRAAAAWVAAAAELARGGIPGDGVHAAEEEIPLLPVDELIPARGERVQDLLVDARLGLHGASLEVQARSLHRLLRVHAVCDHADDRLQDRRADPVRAAASEAHLELAVAEHDRR